MSRGDQRDRDRAKNQAKQQAKLKAQAKTGDPLLRNEKDAEALRAKVEAKKKAKEEQQEAVVNAGKGPIKPKKAGVAKKKTETLDDMLLSGLQARNKKRAAK